MSPRLKQVDVPDPKPKKNPSGPGLKSKPFEGFVEVTLKSAPKFPVFLNPDHVMEYTKDKKVTIFKKRHRKNFKRTTGFRRDVTILRVTDIRHATV